MTKDELKLAFQKAFQMGQDYWYYADHEFESYNKKSDAIRAKFNEMVKETIEEALAQPEQEPVAWMNDSTPSGIFARHMEGAKNFGCTIPLYKTPPQRKPLTDEEVNKLVDDEDWYNDPHGFVRAIEAAHGIKGEA